ncbi:hypothetical protein NKR23_g7102 [Pleurostoma richardsiae]|uniref:Uncharacterized protein n=1 Tax=Pleurostoma richardsiae TaxID=41990 RepID=A0AA38VRL1_9PEZI|nr:hypothetical protein NKR23_g7102 [Pleurostoma richardsiae]
MARSRNPSASSQMKTRAKTGPSAGETTLVDAYGTKLTEEDRIKAIAAEAAKAIKLEESKPVALKQNLVKMNHPVTPRVPTGTAKNPITSSDHHKMAGHALDHQNQPVSAGQNSSKRAIVRKKPDLPKPMANQLSVAATPEPMKEQNTKSSQGRKSIKPTSTVIKASTPSKQPAAGSKRHRGKSDADLQAGEAPRKRMRQSTGAKPISTPEPGLSPSDIVTEIQDSKGSATLRVKKGVKRVAEDILDIGEEEYQPASKKQKKAESKPAPRRIIRLTKPSSEKHPRQLPTPSSSTTPPGATSGPHSPENGEEQLDGPVIIPDSDAEDAGSIEAEGSRSQHRRSCSSSRAAKKDDSISQHQPRRAAENGAAPVRVLKTAPGHASTSANPKRPTSFPSTMPNGVFELAGLYAESWEQSSFAHIDPATYNDPSFGSYTRAPVPPRKQSRGDEMLQSPEHSVSPPSSVTIGDRPTKQAKVARGAHPTAERTVEGHNGTLTDAIETTTKRYLAAARAQEPRVRGVDDTHFVFQECRPGVATSSAKGKAPVRYVDEEDKGIFYFFGYGLYLCPDNMPAELGAEFVGLAKLDDHRFLICGLPKGEEQQPAEMFSTAGGISSYTSPSKGESSRSAAARRPPVARVGVISATGYATVAPVEQVRHYQDDKEASEPSVVGALYALPSRAALDALLASELQYDYTVQRHPVALQELAEETLPIPDHPDEQTVHLAGRPVRVVPAYLVLARPGGYHLPHSPPKPLPPIRLAPGQVVRMKRKLGYPKKYKAWRAVEEKKRGEERAAAEEKAWRGAGWGGLAEGYEREMNRAVALASLMYGVTSGYVAGVVRTWIPRPRERVL